MRVLLDDRRRTPSSRRNSAPCGRRAGQPSASRTSSAARGTSSSAAISSADCCARNAGARRARQADLHLAVVVAAAGDRGRRLPISVACSRPSAVSPFARSLRSYCRGGSGRCAASARCTRRPRPGGRPPVRLPAARHCGAGLITSSSVRAWCSQRAAAARTLPAPRPPPPRGRATQHEIRSLGVWRKGGGGVRGGAQRTTFTPCVHTAQPCTSATRLRCAGSSCATRSSGAYDRKHGPRDVHGRKPGQICGRGRTTSTASGCVARWHDVAQQPGDLHLSGLFCADSYLTRLNSAAGHWAVSCRC